MREDWVEVELSVIAEIVSGKNQKKVVDQNGIYPIYGSGGEIGRANDFLCFPGTIIIGRKGTINSPIYMTEKFWNVDTAFGIAAFQYYHTKLLYYFCIFFNFHSLDKSTAVPSLAKRDILKIIIPLPPLPEQRAIVAKIEALFSELDHGITSLKKAQEQLKVYRQAVLKKAFEGELTKVLLEEKSVSAVGQILTGNTPSKKNRKFYSASDYNFYKPTDLNAGNNVINTVDYLSTLGYEASRQVPAMSILVTCIGATIGKTGLIKKEGGFNQQINAIVPSEHYDSKFIFYQAIGTDFQNQIKNKASSTTLPILNKGKFSELMMKSCSLPKQHQIVQEIESRLSVCDAVEKNISESLNKAEALRQSILKKAFEGKLLTEQEIEACKKEKDWEPAEKLLERINPEIR